MAESRQAIGGDFHLVTYPPGSEWSHRVDVGFPHPEWRPRRPASPGRAAFPGSALLVGPLWFEVVHAETAAGRGARQAYYLRPWDDSFPLRKTYELTAEACRQTTAEHWRRRRQKNTSELLAPLAPLLGMLPAEDQKRLESYYGLPAARNTAISALLFIFLGVVVVFLALALSKGHHFGKYQGVVTLLVSYRLLLVYLCLEAGPRLKMATSGEPTGSLPVALPIVAVRHLLRSMTATERLRAAVERAYRADARTFADARDEVRFLQGGEHDLEVISRLPKDHWLANVTGIRYHEELYVLDERRVEKTADGARHRFLLLRPRHEVLFKSICDYRPEEVQDVFRVRKRRDTAMWVGTLSLFWGLLDSETQLRLERTYDYDPWKFTFWSLVGCALLGTVLFSAGAWNMLYGAPAVEGLKFFFGLFLLWEAALRWKSYDAGELRSSVLGAPVRPLARYFLRWE